MEDMYGIPEILENEAEGMLGCLYNDIMFVLKVPIVNFIFRTLALFQEFLTAAWGEIRTNMLTVNAEEAASRLRYPPISLQAPRINWSGYYDSTTLDIIRKTVFIFNYVNPKLLLIASAWVESLANRPIAGGYPVKGYIVPGIIKGLPEINLVDINEVHPRVYKLLRDIIKEHNALDAASDFRALANFPNFLEISWYYLRPYIGSDEYEHIKSDLLKRSTELARSMPYPVMIDRRYLEKIYSPSSIAGIMGVVYMFQSLLPALIIDGEFFRRIIRA